jgi:hypothetical protein
MSRHRSARRWPAASWAGSTPTWRSPDPGGSTWIASACPWSSGRVVRTGWSPSPTASGWRPTSRQPGPTAPRGRPLVDCGGQVRRGHRRAGCQRSLRSPLSDWQSRWQSGCCYGADHDATGRTMDPTQPAVMFQGSTGRTGRVLLLIRRLQVRVLPGAPPPPSTLEAHCSWRRRLVAVAEAHWRKPRLHRRAWQAGRRWTAARWRRLHRPRGRAALGEPERRP